jgi:hypothetical protein
MAILDIEDLADLANNQKTLTTYNAICEGFDKA